MVEHAWGSGTECEGVVRALDHGMPCLWVDTDAATGVVFVQGAHVARWRPSGHEPVLWMSDDAVYQPGKALRGGVPICLPWFGNHPERTDRPAHGFARIRDWQYAGSEILSTGVRLSFALGADDATRAVFPHEFTATFRVSLGTELSLELCFENAGDAPFTFEEALHTYLAVSDVRQIAIRGLNGARYEDRVTKTTFFERADAVRLGGETDRIYESTEICVLDDPGAGRRVVVAKAGSADTVVWNPWDDKARALADFGDDEWRTMVCIEAANTRVHAVTLAPGQTHRTTARVTAEHSA